MSTLISGVALIGVSLFMLLGFFSSGAAMSLPVAGLTLLVGVGIPGGAGVLLIRSYFRRRAGFLEHRERLRLETQGSEIVRLAARNAGKLTVVEIVAELALDSESAEAVLQRLVEQGVADIEITESGVLVYTFPDVQRLPEKERSKGILDD
jgi:hypothetical protein